MYRIYIDNELLYDPRVDDAVITSGSLDLELNTVGKLKINVPINNPAIADISLMKSIVTVYDEDKIIFRGRPYSPVTDLYKNSNIDFEGELAFLNDTVFEPFDYYGDVEGLFRQVINSHNLQVSPEKRFTVGRVTVRNTTDAGNISRSSTDYLSTWEVMRTKFFNSALGGYLWTRHEGGTTYIDYLADFDTVVNQSIAQAANVITVKKEVNPEELATVIIPLGARLENEHGELTTERLTIKGVNAGRNYIEDPEGINIYGRITKVVVHDAITMPNNLLQAGRNDLQAAMGVSTSFDIRAADLSKAGYDVNSFMIGCYANVSVPNVGAEQPMLIRRMSINLLRPEASIIKIGSEDKTLTSSIASIDELQTVVNDTHASVVDLGNKTQNSIDQLRTETTQEIQTTAQIIREETTQEISSSVTPLEIIAPYNMTIQGVYAGRITSAKLRFSVPIGKTIRNRQTTGIAITGDVTVCHHEGTEVLALNNLTLTVNDTFITVEMTTSLELSDRPVTVEGTLGIVFSEV